MTDMDQGGPIVSGGDRTLRCALFIDFDNVYIGLRP